MDELGKEFLGRGWKFPPSVEVDRGRVASVKNEQDVEESILIILSTTPGERVMRPDFGCGIRTLVFRAINTGLITNVKQTVSDALRRFEARIDVNEVEVDTSEAANGLLRIKIEYRVRSTNQSGNYVYPFYFKEAM